MYEVNAACDVLCGSTYPNGDYFVEVTELACAVSRPTDCTDWAPRTAVTSSGRTGLYEVDRVLIEDLVANPDPLVGCDVATVLALVDGVGQLRQGESGRWIAWQDIEVAGEPTVYPEGSIYVLDRESGESTLVAQGGLGYSDVFTMMLEPLGLIFLNGASSELYVTLPQLEVIDTIPYSPQKLIDDHRALMFPYAIFDAQTRALTPVNIGNLIVGYWYDNGISSINENGGELSHVSFDTNEQRTLATHAVTEWRHTSDDRVLTLSSRSDATLTGPLTIVDSSTLEAAQIDTDVHYASISSYEAADALTVSYAVLDDDPERRGIWLTRLKN